MAYNPNINQNIRFEIKPMLYKKAIIKKEGFWITNFPEGSTDYKNFEAFKCVYFPLNQSNEDFCKEWRTIADKTFYKLIKLKNQALGIAIDDEALGIAIEDEEVSDVTEVNEVNEDVIIDTEDSSLAEQENIEIEQTEE